MKGSTDVQGKAKKPMSTINNIWNSWTKLFRHTRTITMFWYKHGTVNTVVITDSLHTIAV